MDYRFVKTLRRPTVGISGSFGRGNYGDELFVKNYVHWFGGWSDLQLLTALPRQPYLRGFARARVDAVDSVIIGGGDLILPHLERIDQDFIDLAFLRGPVHIAGVGVAQSSTPSHEATLKKWQRFMQDDNIKSIAMRDEGSADWVRTQLKPRIKVDSVPDLAFSLPLPDVNRPEGPPIIGLVTRFARAASEYRLMAETARKLKEKGWQVHHIIGGVGRHGMKDYEAAKALELDGKTVVYTENLNELTQALGRCSLLLSMKLHTSLVAARYRVPVVAVSNSYKLGKLMEAFGTPDYFIDPMDPVLIETVLNGIERPDDERVGKLEQDSRAYMERLIARVQSGLSP